MKYNELHRILSRAGCYETGKKFTTSNHGSAEVKPGTLKSIIRDAGVKF